MSGELRSATGGRGSSFVVDQSFEKLPYELQSKVISPPSADPQAAQTAQTMAVVTTLMFGYFSLSFASGLSIYFIISNILSIVQYSFNGQVNWRNVFAFSAAAPAPVGAKDARKKKK